MEYQNEVGKNERRKIVFFASATVAIILVLIVSIVVVATRKSTPKNVGGDTNSTFSLDESAKEGEKTEEKTETKTETPKTEAKPTATSTQTTTAVVKQDLPNTGPADLVGIAGVAGALTTAGTAYVMRRKKNA